MSKGLPLGFHLVFRAEDDRVLAPDARARRALASAVLRAGRGRGLLAFGAADTHLHVLLLGTRATATSMAKAVALSLRWQLALPVAFDRTRVHPVEDQWHLTRAFRYVQTNAAHHGLRDAARTEASSLHDLLGLRSGAVWLADRVRQHLPRVDRADLVQMLGVPDLPLGPASGVGPSWLDAAAAVRLLPGLDRPGRACTAARAALVDLALPTTRADVLAGWLGVEPRSIRRLAGSSDRPDRAALARQLAWREAIASATSGASAASTSSAAFARVAPAPEVPSTGPSPA